MESQTAPLVVGFFAKLYKHGTIATVSTVTFTTGLKSIGIQLQKTMYSVGILSAVSVTVIITDNQTVDTGTSVRAIF